MKELLNPHRLTLKIKDSKLETNNSHTQIFTRWNNLLQTTSKNEEQLQTDFLNDIFGEILGYTYKRGETETNLEKEEKTELDGQKPDGILGFFTNENKDCRVVIELKDSKTNLDAKQNRKGDSRTPVGQAFDYATKYQGIEFVIVSNFKEIRLYKSTYQGKYQEFKIDDLVNKPDKQKEFQFLLCKQNLIGITKDTGSLVKKLLDDETKRETEIQNKFYKEYKTLREEFVNDILKQNNTTSDTAISKAQKLFDRLLFIRFCEDNNLITKPFEKVDAGKALGLNLWEALKLLFTSIDKGNPPHIHKFNGGLFATDEVFNDIRIETKLLEKLINFLRLYHFKNDISVNILGHIFEQSITDLEALKAGLNDETHDKNQGKRKKDGIFYTPEYITKYIVEEAVGGWLKERKDELKLDELTPQEIPTTKPKKWINPNQELINRYKLYAEKLKQIKVLDPACGSGAFLVEVFNYLENEWLSVSETLKKLGDDTELGLFNYQTVYKSILQNNIYGVDLNSESVQITKLSLWLKTANSRDELTTLDNNIKVGNSLIDDANIDPKAFKWDKEFSFKFDVVVGNPPWGATLSDASLQHLLKFKLDVKTRDSYMFFILQALQLTKEQSFIGVVIPNTWMLINTAKQFRVDILSKDIKTLADLGDGVFEGVTAESSIIVFKNTITNNNVNVEKLRDGKTMSAFDVDKNIWLNSDLSRITILDNQASFLLSNALCGKFPPFKDVASIIWGIKPYQVGHGKPQQTREDVDNRIYHSNIKVGDSWKPLVVGGDVNRYSLTNNHDTFIHYCDGLMYKSNEKIITGEKIIVRQTSSDIKATLDTEKYYPQNSCLIIHSTKIDLRYLLSLLNSKLLNFVYRIQNPQQGKVFAELKPSVIQSLPIPNISTEDQTPFIIHAQKMLDLTKQLGELSSAFLEYLQAKMGSPAKLSTKLLKWYNLKDDEFLTELNKLAKAGKLTSFDERAIFTAFKDDGKKAKEIQSTLTRTDAEIDKMVYTLYGLSEEEIGVVEGLVV